MTEEFQKNFTKSKITFSDYPLFNSDQGSHF